jgi:transcriptional regulator with XRE-family HTH domain
VGHYERVVTQYPDLAGQYVLDRRTDLGWAQADLAREAGVDVATISSLERAGHWPAPATRAKLEIALGWQRGSLQAALGGRRPLLASEVSEDPPRYLDPAEQHIADTPGITREQAELFITMYRAIRHG